MMLNSTAIEGLKRFLQHAEALHPSNNPHRENGFAKEFQEIKDFSSKLKKDPDFSTKHGEKEVNRLKNRYKDILPYDYSRIILPENNGIEGSDYVNGNYIKLQHSDMVILPYKVGYIKSTAAMDTCYFPQGPSNEIVYLTAQGPLPSTVDDFWRMIISHKIQVIVMACREYELGKLKCKRYWPESMEEIMEYGGCKISLISQESLGDGFIIRTLSAKSTKEELKVTQFHYTAWPDHDVPRSATPLIELTMSFRAFVGSDNKVPVLVHCSAGCGRTGTICALDYARSLIQMGRTENFSVFEIVKNLRKQRIAMVQTKGQYELVYKAVKELVDDELKKHRPKGPTSHYVNVEINKEYKEGSTYENVDFIRSIQRLHQEERNASRKPISDRQTPPLSNMAVVLAPRKGIVLAEKTNLLTSKKIDNETDQHKEIPNQLSKEKVKDNLVQTSARPFQNEKPSSGYENVLPLSLASKPPVAQKPQNYVNVVIGSSQKTNEDYVNVTTTKLVPVPSDMNESAATNTVPILDPLVNSSSSYMQKSKPVSLVTKPDVCNKKQSECESPKHQSRVSAESDYVISPILSETSAAPRPQVNQGKLIDVEEPEVKPASVSYKPNPLKQSSFDKEYAPKQFAQQASNSTSHTAVCKQVKTSKPRGQYSLIGAVKSPESPNKNITNPFVKEPKAKGSSSQRMTEAVESDGSSVKIKKLIATSRRLSEGSNAADTNNSQEDFFGTYSVVMEKTITKEKESASIPEPIRSEREKPHIKQRTSDDRYPSNGSRQSAVPIQKAYSTENVNSPMSKEQSIQKSDFSDFALVSTPYRPKDSESLSSALYSSVGNKGSVKTTKPLAALKRSNSGIVASASLSSGDGDGLYATVGVRTKKRPQLSTETWTSNGHLPAIESGGLKHSPNSTSSLRSVTSISSNDSSEEIPPVPVKTTNAFVSPGEEDVYEAVQRSSGKSSTMDRFKAKARNMITSGPQVPKISIGKKNLSPTNTPRSASPVLGERAASYTGCQLGYGNRATKPSGPRSCPGHWPSFS